MRVKPESSVISCTACGTGWSSGSQGYRDAANEAVALRNRSEFAREKLTELRERDVERWARESWELARDVAYRGGTLAGSSDRADGPVLPEGYTTAAKAAAERRVVLAGYRLADALGAPPGDEVVP